MKRILLTGGSGLLGSELRKYREYIAPSHIRMDITNINSVKRVIKKSRTELIVHGAAYTDVLRADIEAEEMVKCYQTNIIGTRNMVQAAGNIPIIYISSEYVLEPVNFYSLTKLQGEKEVECAKDYHIIRTLFKPRPFEHPSACNDIWTLGDYVDKIAPLIDKYIQNPKRKIVYIGTGKKTIYDLAKQSRPNVKPITRNTISIRLPSMEFLDESILYKF